MKQTAAKLGIPYTTYVSYERGDREPDSEQLIQLSDFFDCFIDYLLGRSTEQTKPNMNYLRKIRKELWLTMLEVAKAGLSCHDRVADFSTVHTLASPDYSNDYAQRQQDSPGCSLSELWKTLEIIRPEKPSGQGGFLLHSLHEL